MSNARNALIGPFALPAAATFVLATSAMAVESGVSPDGLSFEVSFGMVEGREYWLEGRASLDSGDWTPATPQSARTGSMRTLSVNRAGTPISTGSLLGDGSLAIHLTHVPDPVTPVIGEFLLLELQVVDDSGRRSQKVFRDVPVEEFTQSFLDLFFSAAEQADSEISGDDADADDDGIDNLIEQAAGLHPREANAQDEATGLDRDMTFRFRAASESVFDAPSSTFSLGGLRFEIEVSTDASNWDRATAPADFTIAAESAANPDGSFTHVVDLVGGAQGKRFYRLRVVRP